MGLGWEKLFKNSPAPANDSRPLVTNDEPGEEAAPANPGPVIKSLGALASGEPGRNGEANSLKVARTFDSIGRRNEGLRTHLDAIEFSFRNIEAIRSQFYETLAPIDQTLVEIERTKVAHLEAERKFEALHAAHERLRGEHAALTLERNGLAVGQEDLRGGSRISSRRSAPPRRRLRKPARRSRIEGRSSSAPSGSLEDNRRRLNTVSEQLPSLRAEFAAKEKRLQEVEQQRAGLQDQNALMLQESRSLRSRIEEFVASASKLNRQLSDLQSRRDDLARRVEELEATLAQETAAHSKLKAAHLDAAEAHRLAAANLREELSAMTSRSEAAERLLAEARETLRERDAEIRGFEQRALETSLALKSKDVALADLEKDVNTARALHAEVDSVRAALDQRSVELAKALEAKDAALQRAERKIALIEGRIAEQDKAIGAEREAFEERLATLKEQLDAEQSARAFAEGALQAARQERGSRRRDENAAAGPKEPPAPAIETARDKIARLRK